MGPYQNLVIYYFTGTGNSKNVATWMAAAASNYDIDCQIINIAHSNRKNIEMPPAGALLIFTSPVHGFNYPPVMLHFIARFPKGQNSVLLMNTRAGMRIGKLVTPGLSGITFLLSSLILKFKGYSITGMLPVDLPSNWISVHPGLNNKAILFIHRKVKERVLDFADRVLSGKKHFRALREIIQDVLVSPIAVLYYLFGRYFLAKTYYASSDCNNCDVCINNCPVKAIIKVDGRPFWTFRCESCMKCMSYCPKKAIETAHGPVVVYSILFSSGLMALFYKYFSLWFSPITNVLLRSIIETIIFLTFLWAWYRLIHYLLRYKWFERIVVYTSLTKYKWWGRRYRALKDF